MRLHGLFIVVTHDKHHVPHPNAKDDGPWAYFVGRLDTDPAVRVQNGLSVAHCGLVERELHAHLARFTKTEPAVWRFAHGAAPRKPLPGKWLDLTEAELKAQQEPGQRSFYVSWLAMLAAEARCRALGVWPPPPTDDWAQATPPADSRQVTLPGVES